MTYLTRTQRSILKVFRSLAVATSPTWVNVPAVYQVTPSLEVWSVTSSDVMAVVRTSTFLFAAGQETTARLLASALKELALHPELQDELRAHHDRIPNFVEETLRVESPVKADFRMARHTTTIGDVEVKAGTPVMLLNGAANRDPAVYANPETLDLRREGNKHLAFGFGIHQCAGLSLARLEGRIAIGRFLKRFPEFTLSAAPTRGGRARFRGFLRAPFSVAA